MSINKISEEAPLDLPGPYLNEEGDWWMPASVPFRVARARIRQHSDAPRLAYVGKAMVPLHDHEDYGDPDDKCQPVLAFHFEERGY